MAAARQNRYGHRDATMILIAFRHGLRASEVADLRWDQVDFNSAVLHIRRVKRGTPSVHPVSVLEMRALRRLQRESQAGPFIFVSERGAPFTTAGFARMMQRAAMTAGLAIKVHPPTCYVTPAGSRSRTQGMIRALCKLILVTRILRIPSDTRNWLPTGSNIFGATEGRSLTKSKFVLFSQFFPERSQLVTDACVCWRTPAKGAIWR
jgi:Phage integrase family